MQKTLNLNDDLLSVPFGGKRSFCTEIGNQGNFIMANDIGIVGNNPSIFYKRVPYRESRLMLA
jgi:hypothetical protein